MHVVAMPPCRHGIIKHSAIGIFTIGFKRDVSLFAGSSSPTAASKLLVGPAALQAAAPRRWRDLYGPYWVVAVGENLQLFIASLCLLILRYDLCDVSELTAEDLAALQRCRPAGRSAPALA